MIIILMDVSGSGKSAIVKELSKAIRLPLYDGDDFHSERPFNREVRQIDKN